MRLLIVIKDLREINERRGYDVIVAGGGIGGIAAAVSAARNGADVLLIEKGLNLGGLATVGLISFYEPLCDGEGTQMIFGIAEELIRLAAKYGFDNIPESWKNGAEKRTNERFAGHFSPTIFAMALDNYLAENGVTLRLDTYVVSPVMEGRRCAGLITESCGGKEFFPAKAVVDATGDALVCLRAGIPTVSGENYLTYLVHGTDTEDVKNYIKCGRGAALRKWWSVGAEADGNGHPAGVRKFSGDTADDITEFMLLGRKMLFDQIKDQPKESREVLTLPGIPPLRTIRHIVGAYTFDGSEEGQTFPDAIGRCGDFRTAGRRFELPERILYHPDYPNIWACGRIVSAEGDGWEITRVIPVCALTGEAAGALAARFCCS